MSGWYIVLGVGLIFLVFVAIIEDILIIER